MESELRPKVYFGPDKDNDSSGSGRGADAIDDGKGTSDDDQNAADDAMAQGEDESMEDYFARMNETHGK